MPALSPSHPRALPPAALIAAWLAAGVAGCGGGDDARPDGQRVDTADFAQRVQRELTAITGTVVDNVACPSDVVATPGTRFECGGSFNGEADGVLVTVTEGAGGRTEYSFRLRNLLLGKLETQIRESFERQKVRLVSLDCPGPQPQRKGGTFTCTGVDRKGRRLAIAVRQTDDAGAVTFRVVR